MHILIAGMRGFIGQALAEHLSALGHSITGLSRNPSRLQNTPFAWLDFASFENLDPLPFDAIINLCGAPLLGFRWTRAYKKKLLDSRVLSSEAIAKKILHSQNPPKVFIQASGVGFYPATGGPYTELSPPGEGFLSELCLAWEKASERIPCRRLLLRMGIVLGRKGGLYPLLRTSCNLGFGTTIGSGQQPIAWIHIDDLCRLVAFCLQNDEAEGAVNAVAPCHTRQGAFIQELAQALRRPCLLRAPNWLIKLFLGEASTLLLSGSEVVPEKSRVLGFKFTFDTLQFAIGQLESTPQRGILW